MLGAEGQTAGEQRNAAELLATLDWLELELTGSFCCRSGRGDPAHGPPERHPGPAVGADLRGAAGVEAAAADRLHRRPAQRLRGPAAELVGRPTTLNTTANLSFHLPPPLLLLHCFLHSLLIFASPFLPHLSSPFFPPAGSPPWRRLSSRSVST